MQYMVFSNKQAHNIQYDNNGYYRRKQYKRELPISYEVNGRIFQQTVKESNVHRSDGKSVMPPAFTFHILKARCDMGDFLAYLKG